jgi:hypothetical protein
LKNFSTILVEGKIIGNINDVESITLKESAVVFGNISCKSIETLPNSTIIGYLNIDPFLIINKNDSNNNNNKHHQNELQGGNHDDGTVSPENSDTSKDQKLPSPRLIPMNESSNMPSMISGNQQVNTNKVKNEIPQKVIVLIIDPQIDFHFGGSMAINGANEDSERIAEFIKDNIPKIDEVFVTLDSHHRMHIAHGIFWKNESNESPTADTIITLGDFDRTSCLIGISFITIASGSLTLSNSNCLFTLLVGNLRKSIIAPLRFCCNTGFSDSSNSASSTSSSLATTFAFIPYCIPFLGTGISLFSRSDALKKSIFIKEIYIIPIK